MTASYDVDLTHLPLDAYATYPHRGIMSAIEVVGPHGLPHRARAARIVAAVASAAMVVSPAPALASSTRAPRPPRALTVDGRLAPIGVDDVAPDFAWQLAPGPRGSVQSAYRVVVSRRSSTAPARGDLVWDSGRVASRQQAFVPYRGPALLSDARYWWTVRIWDAGGRASPFATPVRFDTGLRDTDWRAAWIRRASAGEPEEYTFARTDFSLKAAAIDRAVAYMSASQQAELWINGTRVAQGPSFAYPDDGYYLATDVTLALRSGVANAIGALYHWSGTGKGRPASEPGVIVQVSVEYGDGTRQLVTTDGSWRVQRAPWLPAPPRNQDSGDFVEALDGRAWPLGWDQPGFDDAAWQVPTVVGRHPAPPFTHLTAQRGRIVETPVRPVAFTRTASGAFVADFGRVIAAVTAITFHRGVAGRAISLRAGYLLDEQGDVSTSRGTQGTDMSTRYVERAGEQTFRTFSYLGFRYLQVDAPGEVLAAGDVVAYARHSDVPDEHAASFSSSDPTLDAVWELARHSALFASQEQFIDTPTREKGPFLRDAFNESETAMRAFGEQNLTRQVLLEFARSQSRYWPDGRLNAVYPAGQGKRDIPDYTEIYPEWVWQYYENTGDRGLLDQLYPVLVNIADYVARYVDPTTGLVTDLAGGGDEDYKFGIVDWPPAMRYGYDVSTVARTTVNILAIDALSRVVEVAAALRRPSAEVDTQRRRAEALTEAVGAHLTRPDGVYVDGLRADGTQSGHASQQANAMALAAGLVPALRQKTVADHVVRLGMAMGPMTAEALLRALHAARRDGDLVATLTNRHQPGWANILDRGGTFTWEAWDPIDAEGDSMSHGWGSTVLVAMQEALLGVRPTAPGWATLDMVAPATLHRVEGVVRIPAGRVTVSWVRTRADPRALTAHVTIPPNATATVHVPAKRASDVTEGGGAAAHATGVHLLSLESGTAVFRVGSGTYTFRRCSACTRGSHRAVALFTGIAGVVLASLVTLVAVRRRRSRALRRAQG